MSDKYISVFEHYKNNESYEFTKFIDTSLKTCVSDPQNSIIKSYRVLEGLVEELYFGFHLEKKSDDMYRLISDLGKDIEDDVKNDMHTIRLIRNKASHSKESSYVNLVGSEVDFSEAIYVLKKLYDILGWFINIDRNPKLVFLPFQELIDEILDKSIERKHISIENKTNLDVVEQRIGIFVQTKVIDLLERQDFSDQEIGQYTQHEYSFNTFGLTVPFLSTTRNGKMKSRYYSKPAKIKGKRYYISNSWNENNKPLLQKWLKEKHVQFGLE